MLREYFVDAWYFIALNDPHDTHHRRATRLSLALSTARMVTHDGVLSEVLSFFSEEDPRIRKMIARVVRAALRDMTVVTPDRQLFLKALELYERRTDKHYSHIDCVSMVVMRDRGITHVLTNDHHFTQEGFTVLADAP